MMDKVKELAQKVVDGEVGSEEELKSYLKDYLPELTDADGETSVAVSVERDSEPSEEEGDDRMAAVRKAMKKHGMPDNDVDTTPDKGMSF